MRTIDVPTLTRLFCMTEADVLRWITDFDEHFSPSAKGVMGGTAASRTPRSN